MISINSFKKVSLTFLFILISSMIYAQTYRYGIIKQNGTSGTVAIFDLSEALPENAVDGSSLISLNTSEERLSAESDYRNIQASYYSGSIQLTYMDLRNPETPEYKYLYSWSDFLSYVRGDK